MKTRYTNTRITRINFIIVAYFLSLVIITVLDVNSTIIGVIAQTLTLPMLLLQWVFIDLSAYFVTTYKANVLSYISLIVLLLCVIITVGSFWM